VEAARTVQLEHLRAKLQQPLSSSSSKQSPSRGMQQMPRRASGSLKMAPLPMLQAAQQASGQGSAVK
jgi:hypothetical protein